MTDHLSLSLNQVTGITAVILKSSGVDLDTGYLKNFVSSISSRKYSHNGR